MPNAGAFRQLLTVGTVVPDVAAPEIIAVDEILRSPGVIAQQEYKPLNPERNTLKEFGSRRPVVRIDHETAGQSDLLKSPLRLPRPP